MHQSTNQYRNPEKGGVESVDSNRYSGTDMHLGRCKEDCGTHARLPVHGTRHVRFSVPGSCQEEKADHLVLRLGSQTLPRSYFSQGIPWTQLLLHRLQCSVQ